ncbi:MAG TPA: hypothetical protein VE666_02245 [Mycobacterium sp.]|nr:hypothetical protein [Mycobacterium sp.]
MVWPGDGAAAPSGAEAVVAETSLTDPACVPVRMAPLAATVTRMRDAPNDRTALVTAEAAVPLRSPVVTLDGRERVPGSTARERVPRSTWPTADALAPSSPGRTDERPLRVTPSPWPVAADVDLLAPERSV